MSLVEYLAKALGTYGAYVTLWHGEKRLRAVAFWLGDRWVDDYEYDLAGTPCPIGKLPGATAPPNCSASNPRRLARA